MTEPGESQNSTLLWFTDLSFRVTISHMRPEALWPAGRMPFLNQ